MRLARMLVVGCAAILGRGDVRDAVRSPDAATAILARGPVAIATSPDGERVLVDVPRERGFELDVVARRTGARLARRDDDDPAVAPVWRRDGGAIAYFRARGHRHAYDLRIWDLAADRALGVPATATSFARFSPDGTRIAYLATDARRYRVLTVAAVADPQPRALVSVAEHAEAEWSPDGERLATATAAAPGALTVLGPGRASIAIPIVDGELRDFAWSADGRVVAVTGRGTRDAYLRLFRVRLADRAVEALSPADGDAHAPQFLGDDLAVHVERDGERRIHLAGATGSRAIGRSDASARLTGVAGGSAIVVYRSRTGPAYVAAVPIGPGPAPPDLTAVPRGSAALRIDVIARDRAHLPAYLWRAAHPVGGVVIVHGGPALHASPAWNEKVQLLVDAGLDVLKLDYRGSTGHGAAFEALGASADRIGDVLAARDQLARAAGVPPERIIVLGESYGAGLAAAAAAEASASPTVLVSTQPLPATAAPRSGRCPVIAFHGADDDISPPPAAHTYLTRLFGDAVQWHLVPDEGHNFARTRSWAAVYAALLALRDDPCR